MDVSNVEHTTSYTTLTVTYLVLLRALLRHQALTLKLLALLYIVICLNICIELL